MEYSKKVVTTNFIVLINTINQQTNKQTNGHTIQIKCTKSPHKQTRCCQSWVYSYMVHAEITMKKTVMQYFKHESSQEKKTKQNVHRKGQDKDFTRISRQTTDANTRYGQVKEKNHDHYYHPLLIRYYIPIHNNSSVLQIYYKFLHLIYI